LDQQEKIKIKCRKTGTGDSVNAVPIDDRFTSRLDWTAGTAYRIDHTFDRVAIRRLKLRRELPTPRKISGTLTCTRFIHYREKYGHRHGTQAAAHRAGVDTDKNDDDENRLTMWRESDY
jgi:hypothetical protein